MSQFPELTSFGTLFSFAIALEASLAELHSAAAGDAACADRAEQLGAWAKKHTKRHKLLQQLQRERLNEVVLQQLSGMRRDDYLPTEALPTGDASAIVDALVNSEVRAVRFYADAARLGKDVLTGVEKTLQKYGKQSNDIAGTLR